MTLIAAFVGRANEYLRAGTRFRRRVVRRRKLQGSGEPEARFLFDRLRCAIKCLQAEADRLGAVQ